MKKLFLLTCSALFLTIGAFGQVAPIWGATSGCPGDISYVFDTSFSAAPGFWFSSNPSVATISPGGTSGPSMGTITGVSAGVTTITFTDGTFSAYMAFTVNPAPAAITGSPTVCIGASTPYSCVTPGGTWTTSSTRITLTPTTGIATGVSPGTASINYTLGTGCSSPTFVVTVTGTPIDSVITGPATVCIGATISLSNTTVGGAWTSSSSSIVSVASSGVATGVAAGSATITYSVPAGCGSGMATKNITVLGATTAGSISGASSLYIGSTIALTDPIPSGAWSSSNTSVATVGASSGIVTGISAGTATISYSVSGCTGTATATTGVTVSAINGISGNVIFSGAPFYGNVKVWLITYNSTTFDLQAIDSMTVFCSGSSVYYQFLGVATGDYRMKAAADDTAYGTTGYIPTYHTSSSYWSTATVLTHLSGTSDVNQDITMGIGTVTAGPGFIAGNVTMGANKGTAGTVPAAGMLMYVQNASTHAIMQRTYTDAAGAYSFSNLPIGSYIIYPEALNYATTAYTGITISGGSPSMTAANFVQHTVSKTITPANVRVNNTASNTSSVFTFPNPSNGKMNVQWELAASETSNVTVADITGRELYKTTIEMTEGKGAQQLDLSALSNGLYLISIKSASVNYNSKIQVQR